MYPFIKYKTEKETNEVFVVSNLSNEYCSVLLCSLVSQFFLNLTVNMNYLCSLTNENIRDWRRLYGQIEYNYVVM